MKLQFNSLGDTTLYKLITDMPQSILSFTDAIDENEVMYLINNPKLSKKTTVKLTEPFYDLRNTYTSTNTSDEIEIINITESNKKVIVRLNDKEYICYLQDLKGIYTIDTTELFDEIIKFLDSINEVVIYSLCELNSIIEWFDDYKKLIKALPENYEKLFTNEQYFECFNDNGRCSIVNDEIDNKVFYSLLENLDSIVRRQISNSWDLDDTCITYAQIEVDRNTLRIRGSYRFMIIQPKDSIMSSRKVYDRLDIALTSDTFDSIEFTSLRNVNDTVGISFDAIRNTDTDLYYAIDFEKIINI